MRKILSLIISAIILLSSICTASATNEYDNEFSFDSFLKPVEVPVYLDGIELEFDVPAQIISDRTMVPLRGIFEALGVAVEWDDTTKTAISQKGDTVVKITIDEYKLYKNGEEIALDTPAQIVNSRTLVPIRAIAESFDCEVEWLDHLRVVRIVSVCQHNLLSTPNDETILYYLNDEPISKATFDFYTFLIKNNIGSTPAQDEVLTVLKQFYAMKVIVTDYRKDYAKLDRDYVNAYFDYILSNGTYESLMTIPGATDSSIYEYLEAIYYTSLLSKCYYAFSDKEILEYARTDYIKVKHILVKTIEEAQTVLSLLENGSSFEELVSAYSIDGMDVDYGYVFTKGDMVKPFEEASFALNDGEISTPVESQFGYHIIKKYPISELTDEFILLNYRDKIYSDINGKYIDKMVEKISLAIVVKNA